MTSQHPDQTEINIDQSKLLLLIKLFYWIYWIPKLGAWWYRLFQHRLVYRFEEDCLVCESGVFFYKKKKIPYEAIREATVYQGPILQLLGTSIVRVQTAGQNTGWPEISFLCPTNPEDLVETIMQRTTQAKRSIIRP